MTIRPKGGVNKLRLVSADYTDEKLSMIFSLARTELLIRCCCLGHQFCPEAGKFPPFLLTAAAARAEAQFFHLKHIFVFTTSCHCKTSPKLQTLTSSCVKKDKSFTFDFSRAQFGQWLRDQAFIVNRGHLRLVIFDLHVKNFGFKTFIYVK